MVATEELNKDFAVSDREGRLAGALLGVQSTGTHVGVPVTTPDAAAVPLLTISMGLGGSGDSYCQNDTEVAEGGPAYLSLQGNPQETTTGETQPADGTSG